MSRSRRHTPIMGMTTADSEAWDKRAAHGRLRAATRRALQRDGEDHEVTPLLREVSNPWTMAKDGRQRFTPAGEMERYMRK